MKYCTKCGHSNPVEASFCERCGSKLNQEAPKQSVSPTNNYYNDSGEPMPDTYLWQSIVVTILCCLPLGIPSIVYASQVESRYRSGDIEGARRSSKNAKNFALWSLIAGLVGVFFYIIYFVVILGFSFSQFAN